MEFIGQGGRLNIEWKSMDGMCGSIIFKPTLPKGPKRWNKKVKNFTIQWNCPICLWYNSPYICSYVRGDHIELRSVCVSRSHDTYKSVVWRNL